MWTDWMTWLGWSTLVGSAAILLVLMSRNGWLRLFGARNILWLWLLIPAAYLALSLPRSEVTIDPVPVLAVTAGSGESAVAERASIAEQGFADVPMTTLSGVAAWFVSRFRISLPWIWLLGALGTAGWMLRTQLRFRRRLGILVARSDGTHAAQTSDIGPVALGLFRPRIVVPSDFDQRYPPIQRALILAHEHQHLRRGDLQLNLLLCVWRCTNWFNPLVHLAVARLRFDLELSCDAQVLRRFPHARRSYADAMLNTQLADLGLPVGCAWQSSHPLTWRIMMIKQPSTGLVRVALSAGLACAASVAFAATAWSAIPPVEIAKPLPVATMAPRANPAPRSKPLAAPGLIAEPSAPAATVPVVSSADKGVAFAAPLPAAVAIELAAAAVEQGARHPVLLASNDRPAPTQPALVASTRAPKQDHIEHPEFLHAAKPRYPRSARGSLIPETGVVVLSIDLDERGNPLSAAVVSSDLGKDFEKAAMTAMLKSRFKPARKNGVAVTCTTLVPVYFERDLDIRHSNRYAVPGPTRSGAFQHQRIDITNRRPG